MNYLLKKIAFKKLHLYACIITIMVIINNASAEGWIVNPATNEKTENYYRFRQAAPGRFKKDSYVTKEISDGVKLVLANRK